MSEESSDTSAKLYYRIREVSQITGVKPHVLRYWETEFPALKPEKGPNEQRRYRAGDIELIEQIKRLLYEEKFTIAGARRRLRTRPPERTSLEGTAGPLDPAARRPEIEKIARRLSRVRQELVDLQAFLAG